MYMAEIMYSDYDSDYVFSISITDLTELLSLYWKVHLLLSVFNFGTLAFTWYERFFTSFVKPCRANADALKRILTH